MYTILLLLILALLLSVRTFMKSPKFGSKPSEKQLAELKKSTQYFNGAFNNQSHTPALTEGVSMLEVLREFFFKKEPRRKPKQALPTVKTNLLPQAKNQDILIWFGHSSYFMQIDGKTVLVDPVFSGAASPLSFTTKAFQGTDIYGVDDLPHIDYLFISHDHWDHMDYETLLGLKSKVGQIICGLGTGAHLVSWGFNPDLIKELDWNEPFFLENSFEVHSIPGRHFSGRGFKRNQTLWTSFVLKTPTYNLFLGGDSGYDTHFKEAGEKFGPFDLAILENGQYDKSWKYIHMHPDEVLQAAKDLKANRLLPVHSCKFALANHAWDEPLKQITKLHTSKALQLITPKIGEQVNLKDLEQVFSQWWLAVDPV